MTKIPTPDIRLTIAVLAIDNAVDLPATLASVREAADEVIVVADSTKLGRQSLALLSELQAVDRLVVDREITNDWQKKITEAGVELVIASE